MVDLPPNVRVLIFRETPSPKNLCIAIFIACGTRHWKTFFEWMLPVFRAFPVKNTHNISCSKRILSICNTERVWRYMLENNNVDNAAIINEFKKDHSMFLFDLLLEYGVPNSGPLNWYCQLKIYIFARDAYEPLIPAWRYLLENGCFESLKYIEEGCKCQQGKACPLYGHVKLMQKIADKVHSDDVKRRKVAFD